MAKKNAGSAKGAAKKAGPKSGVAKPGAKKAAPKKAAPKKAASRSGASSSPGKAAPRKATAKSAPAKKKSAPKRGGGGSQGSEHGSHTTVDHEEIQRWVEERGGYPATVRRTEQGHDPGLLRIEFSEESESSLEKIEWDDFFEKFDEKNLAFLYQAETASGEQSRFNKFVDRANVDAGGAKKKQSKNAAGSKRRK